MKNYRIIPTVVNLLFVFLIAGCATPAQQFSAPRIVEVPVAVQAPPPDIPRPKLAIDSLSNTSNSAEVVRMYRATVEQLISYSEALETALDAYKPLISKQ